jgi:two-component system sensor histidine kinase UhpB
MRTQLLIAVAIVNLCALLIAGTVTVLNAREATRLELEGSFEVAKRFVLATIQGVVADGKVDDLGKRINQLTSRLQLAQLRHVRIYVGDASGKLTQVSPRPGGKEAAAKPTPAPSWFAALIAPQLPVRQSSFALVGGGNGSALIVEQPLQSAPSTWSLGTVVLAGEPVDEIAEVWHDVKALALVWLLLGAFVVATLYLVLSRMLAPLASLARGMLKLEDGHYATRLADPNVQELSALADGFNNLAGALDRARDENARLYGQLIMVQEDERREIANELHDEASPCLFGITANALSAQRLAGTKSDRKTRELRGHLGEILKVTDRLNQMNRMLLKKLRPVALGRVALSAVAEDLVRELQRRYPEVAISPSIRMRMPSFGEAVDLTVYRCLQEGVTNSIRHGKAGAIDVELVEKRPRAHAGNGANGAANGKANGAANGVAAVPELHLRIQDDGRGIAPDTPLGFGLTVMRERVTALGGTCTIKSTPANGTTLRIVIPMSSQPKDRSHSMKEIQFS